MPEQRILVVDDEPSVCKVITRVLAAKGFAPVAAHSGGAALAELAAGAFDAVVLDIRMPEMDGFEVLAKIRETDAAIPVVILSADNENYSMLLGLESGADDYMTKPFEPMFLAAKLQALLRREGRKGAAEEPPANLSDGGGLSYNLATRRLTRDGTEIALSAKERALVRLFMENPGKVFSKEELYTQIWSDGQAPAKTDDNTVMVHINRLRAKIEPDPKNPRHILTVWGSGYKLGSG